MVGHVDLHRDDVDASQQQFADVLLVDGHFLDLQPAVPDRFVPLVPVRIACRAADLPTLEVVDRLDDLADGGVAGLEVCPLLGGLVHGRVMLGIEGGDVGLGGPAVTDHADVQRVARLPDR